MKRFAHALATLLLLMGLIVVPIRWDQVASVYAQEHDDPPPEAEHFDGSLSQSGFLIPTAGEFMDGKTIAVLGLMLARTEG